MYAAHSRPHLTLLRVTTSSSQAWRKARQVDRKIRCLNMGELFGELHVNGLRALATAIRLGFESHALTFVDGGQA